jgi:hypothetical protein
MISCEEAVTQTPGASTPGGIASTTSTTGIPAFITTITTTSGTTSVNTTVTPGKISLESLVEIAGCVLVGQVTNITTSQQIDGRVYSLVVFSVSQTVKGQAGAEVTIKVPGGEIGGIGSISTDTPAFHQGEKAVVFLVADGDYYTVTGGFYGKVTVDANNMAGGLTLAAYLDQIQATITRH